MKFDVSHKLTHVNETKVNFEAQSVYIPQRAMESERNPPQITQLPDHVLKKILSLVPCRKNVENICKKFYGIICEIDRFKVKAIISCYERHVS